MDQLPTFLLDHEAARQVRETRATLLEHLATTPDDLMALVVADVLAEIDPDHDPILIGHAERFRRDHPMPRRWRDQARKLGIDRLLFKLADGMKAAQIGRAAVPVLARRAAEICEARPFGVARGHIDATMIPDELASARIEYHVTGHLARVVVDLDPMHRGELTLDETPGAGDFTLVAKRGGYGTVIREQYDRGSVLSILNTPWHDGEESREVITWTRWVQECLASIADLMVEQARKPRRKRAAP